MKTRRRSISEDHPAISRRNSQSSTLLNGIDLIPSDLIIEILSILPVKSIARCRCVSKHWSSILRRPEFTDLILTRSPDRPQLLFVCVKEGSVFFFSSPQSLTVPNYHMQFPLGVNLTREFYYVHGLVCVKHVGKVKGRNCVVHVICNPSTGQSLTLPKLKTRKVEVASFFGYEPVHKQFKLLSMTTRRHGTNEIHEEHQILTLGRNGKWRRIDCSVPHCPSSNGICVDGVLYYQAYKGIERKYGIVCFDIRLEKFEFIEEEEGKEVMNGELVIYKGKLATLKTDGWPFGVSEYTTSFELCVLEDAEKNEWSRRTYAVPPLLKDMVAGVYSFFIGLTRTCEIVFSALSPPGLSYLIYYNLERNTVVKVETQGLDMFYRHDVYTFLNHVEDVKLGGLFSTS